MIDSGAPDNSQIVVLLCIGDVSSADDAVALPLISMFGKPMIHHMIKSLQHIGISRFCIGVDSVPGALLTYRDAAAKEGVEIGFIREPSAMAALLAGNMRALILRADTIWNIGLIDRALRRGKPLIATVDERGENQMFERIDLNNRWAGMAILDRASLEALTQLPDGWDMASALLRQALQDGVELWPLKQSEIQDGHIRRLENAGDLAAAQSVLMASPVAGPVTLEAKLFSRPFKRFAPAIWAVSWGRGMAEFSFPGIAFGAAVLAVAKFPLGAAMAATVAISAALIRNIVRSAEYRAARSDWTGIAGWALLTAALIGVLKLTEPSLFEAGLLGLTLAGLSLASANHGRGAQFRLLSPLVIALALAFGAIVGVAGLTVKLLIAAEIILQLQRGSGLLKNPETPD